jgi:hypothetical protein
MIDWRYRVGRAPVEKYRIDLGLYTLAGEGDQRRWLATPLVQQFITQVNHPAEAIGDLAPLPDYTRSSGT